MHTREWLIAVEDDTCETRTSCDHGQDAGQGIGFLGKRRGRLVHENTPLRSGRSYCTEDAAVEEKYFLGLVGQLNYQVSMSALVSLHHVGLPIMSSFAALPPLFMPSLNQSLIRFISPIDAGFEVCSSLKT